MNYFSFYNKGKELLIDSLASLWFKGQAHEQEYIKRILTEDEPLFAEPVFQSIFPWEESVDSFESHFSKLGLLTSSFVNALSSEEIDKDLRFPLIGILISIRQKAGKLCFHLNHKPLLLPLEQGQVKLNVL